MTKLRDKDKDSSHVLNLLEVQVYELFTGYCYGNLMLIVGFYQLCTLNVYIGDNLIIHAGRCF